MDMLLFYCIATATIFWVFLVAHFRRFCRRNRTPDTDQAAEMGNWRGVFGANPRNQGRIRFQNEGSVEPAVDIELGEGQAVAANMRMVGGPGSIPPPRQRANQQNMPPMPTNQGPQTPQYASVAPPMPQHAIASPPMPQHALTAPMLQQALTAPPVPQHAVAAGHDPHQSLTVPTHRLQAQVAPRQNDQIPIPLPTGAHQGGQSTAPLNPKMSIEVSEARQRSQV